MYYSGAVAFRWPFHPLYFRSFRRIQQQYTENVHHYRFRSVIIANVLENYDSILYDALQMFDVSPSPSFKWNQCLDMKHHAGAEHTYTHTDYNRLEVVMKSLEFICIYSAIGPYRAYNLFPGHVLLIFTVPSM